MSVKNVLTEKFLGAIESMELVTRLIFLLPLTPSELRRPTLDYTSLQRKLLNEWDGGAD